jgi:hypothetical protein
MVVTYLKALPRHSPEETTTIYENPARTSGFRVEIWTQDLKNTNRSRNPLENKLAQAVTFLICIRKVPGWGLGRDRDCLHWGISWISSGPSGKFWDRNKTNIIRRKYPLLCISSSPLYMKLLEIYLQRTVLCVRYSLKCLSLDEMSDSCLQNCTNTISGNVHAPWAA